MPSSFVAIKTAGQSIKLRPADSINLFLRAVTDRLKNFTCRFAFCINSALAEFKGSRIKLIIFSAFINKALMVALFNDFALFKNNNLFGIAYR